MSHAGEPTILSPDMIHDLLHDPHTVAEPARVSRPYLSPHLPITRRATGPILPAVLIAESAAALAFLTGRPPRSRLPIPTGYLTRCADD